ncbi:DUF2125 domain-containing protein [Rhizobium sp. PAMB 3182]
MAAPAPGNRSIVSGRVYWLAAAVLVAIVLYTGGWYVAASQLKTRVAEFLAGSGAADGIGGQCSALDVRGYPFRIGLFCDKLAIDDSRQGLSATFGALRSAAQIYQPGHVVFELDGPAELRTTYGLFTHLEWSSLQSSFRAGLGGVSKVDLIAKDITGSVSSSLAKVSADVKSGHGEAHLRANGADLDVALLAEDVNATLADPAQKVLPPFSTSIDLTLTGKAGLLAGKERLDTVLRNSEGQLRGLAVDLGEGRIVTASGPFSVDENGFISGRIRVEIERIQAWRDLLVSEFPEAAGQIRNVADILKSIAGKHDNGTISLDIEDGAVFVSFIPIGYLPPL